MLGPDWKDEKKTLEEQRLLALLAPPRGSPFFAVTASHDRGAPATTLRPAEPAEDRKLKTVRELQAKISQHLGCRKNPSGADMQAVLSSYGAGWGEMVPLYQIAINATDQGVRVP